MFGRKKPQAMADEAAIDDVLSRSVAEVLPSKAALKKELMSGRRLRIYIGVDATGTQLHLGHATNFLILERLRKLGHEIIVLFGDFTALIGDPSGHDTARKQLTEKEVENNIATWKTQVSKIISLDDPSNPAKILRNSSWLSKLALQDVISLAANFTVQQMLERDLFEKRIEEQKPLYLHEFLYPVFQGQDSVAMDVDVEIGGTDQTFNMLAGRTLQQKTRKKEKFVIATTLLENPKTGEKLMSKSLGDFIALDETPRQMFGKIMALPDEVVEAVFIDCTLLSLPHIQEVLSGHPKDAKIALAKEIVRMYHGEPAAKKVADDFSSVFSKGNTPSEIPEVRLQGRLLMEVLVSENIVTSKSDYRRLITEGAIRILPSEEKLTDPNATVSTGTVLRIGKHRFVKVVG